MMMPAVRWFPFLGSTVNFGNSDRATFMRKVALSHFQPFIRAAIGYQMIEQQLGIDPGYNDCRIPSFAIGNHACGPARVDDDFFNRSIKQNVDARFTAGPRHRLGNRAHSPNCVAPGSGHSRCLSEKVVKEHVSCTWRLRRGEITNDAVEAEQCLGKVALEMPLENLRCASNGKIVNDPRFSE